MKPTGLVPRSSLKHSIALSSISSCLVTGDLPTAEKLLQLYQHTGKPESKAGSGCLNNLFSHSTKRSTAAAGSARGIIKDCKRCRESFMARQISTASAMFSIYFRGKEVS